jgi:hypothetical protein
MYVVRGRRVWKCRNVRRFWRFWDSVWGAEDGDRYPKVTYINNAVKQRTFLLVKSVANGNTVPSSVMTKNPLCSAGAVEIYSSTFLTMSSPAIFVSVKVHFDDNAGKLK